MLNISPVWPVSNTCCLPLELWFSPASLMPIDKPWFIVNATRAWSSSQQQRLVHIGRDGCENDTMHSWCRWTISATSRGRSMRWPCSGSRTTGSDWTGATDPSSRCSTICHPFLSLSCGLTPWRSPRHRNCSASVFSSSTTPPAALRSPCARSSLRWRQKTSFSEATRSAAGTGCSCRKRMWL